MNIRNPSQNLLKDCRGCSRTYTLKVFISLPVQKWSFALIVILLPDYLLLVLPQLIMTLEDHDISLSFFPIALKSRKLGNVELFLICVWILSFKWSFLITRIKMGFCCSWKLCYIPNEQYFSLSVYLNF